MIILSKVIKNLQMRDLNFGGLFNNNRQCNFHWYLSSKKPYQENISPSKSRKEDLETSNFRVSTRDIPPSIITDRRTNRSCNGTDPENLDGPLYSPFRNSLCLFHQESLLVLSLPVFHSRLLFPLYLSGVHRLEDSCDSYCYHLNSNETLYDE